MADSNSNPNSNINLNDAWISLECLGVPKYEINLIKGIRNKDTGKSVKVHGDNPKKYVGLKFALGNNKFKSLLAHVVMASIFIPNLNPETHKTVDHINRHKGDNRIENLRWANGKIQNDNKENNKRVKGRSIRQMDTNGNIVKIWNSMAELKRYHKTDHRQLVKLIEQKILIERKFYYEYNDIVDFTLYTDEEWRLIDHPEIPKEIHVSNYSRVREGNMLHEGHIRDEYYRISFSHGDGVGYEYSIHILVAEVFCQNPENKPFVNHKDGNKLNNHASNLEYVTHQENMIHAVKMGLRTYDKQCIPVERDNNDGTFMPFRSSEDAAKYMRELGYNVTRGEILRSCNRHIKVRGYYFRHPTKNEPNETNSIPSSEEVIKMLSVF